MDIKFITDTKAECQLKQYERLTSSNFTSNDKKRSLVIKTLRLFKLKREIYVSVIKHLCQIYKLDMTSEIHTSIVEYLNKKSFNKLTLDNYYFVTDEISETDMEYLKGKYLDYREVQFYLYKLTKYLIETHYKGKRVLARDYVLKFKDSYTRYCKKTINKNKTAHLNKLVSKYQYVYLTDNNRTFVMGDKHPLFNTNMISASNRKFSNELKMKNLPTSVNERVRMVEQSRDIMISAFKHKDEECEYLKQEIDLLKEKNRWLIRQIKYYLAEKHGANFKTVTFEEYS